MYRKKYTGTHIFFSKKQHIQVKATHSGTEPTGGSSRLQIPIHRNDFHKHYVHQDHTHHDDDPQQCKSANNCHHEKYDHPFLAPGHPTTVSQIRAACDERRTHEDIVNHSPYLQSIVNQHDDDLVHHKTHKSYRNQQQAYQQQQDKRH